MVANGVKKIFFCGGTDNFHFMESVAKFKALGKPAPDLITVMHESNAVYMNMGYFQWSGRPQVTLLHVDSGTINAGAAWLLLDNLTPEEAARWIREAGGPGPLGLVLGRGDPGEGSERSKSARSRLLNQRYLS